MGQAGVSNSLVLLHSFFGLDGELPKGGLVRDSAGNLYGTASGGGVYNYGTVFKLDATGTLSTLYSFNGLSDGAAPEGPLLLEKGKLYGANRSGGAAGAGTVFEVDPNTGTITILHGFAPPSGENLHNGGVARDPEGNLYRVDYTARPSAASGEASAQPIVEVRALEYLIALRGLTTPADLVLDSEGRLYGAARSIGSGSYAGTIFEVSTNADQDPLAYPLCVFNPPSMPQTLSWFNDGTGQSSFYYGYNPPSGATVCRVPGVSYSASWLSGVTAQPPAGAYGGGTGYISFVAAVNTSTAPRRAAIRLGSAFVLTLTQRGYPTKSCQYSPPTATIEVVSGGGTVGTVGASILVPPGHDGCIVYAATSKAPWISNLSPSANQAVGGGSVCGATPCVTGEYVTPTFNVAANLGAARSAVVRLSSGFALTVNQDAGN